MPLTNLEFKAGIDKEATDYSSKGGWVDGNLVRFRKSRVEKIGGWIKLGTNAFLGVARALHSWIELGGVRYLGLGTTFKYYVESGDLYYDVTPIRSTTSAGDVTFAATNGSSTITVTDTGHGAVNNDFVTFSGAASLGGNITATVLNQEYQIVLVTSANAYTIVAKDTSGSTVTANSSDSGNGGSSTVGTYQINVGLDVYVQATGWGAGTWGAGTWGSTSAIANTGQLRLWTHDNFGENLIINPRGGGIFRWLESGGLSTRAVALSGVSGADLVPTVGLQVITSEIDRHLIVLGADPISGASRSGSIDPMLIAFSDGENELDFNPTATNSAGSVRISAGSFIIGAIKSRQEILIWTDTSLYSMQFIGPPLTFAVNLVNEGAGLVGPKAAVTAPIGVFFASKTGFFIYTGAVKKLPCTVQEYVFNDLDLGQAFKCHMGLNSEYGEMWFFYPSKEDGTGEISRYVIYNYEENHWSIGSLVRYAWLDAGIEDVPLATATDNSEQFVFQHEVGYDNLNAGMSNVFIESGDIDISAGENFSFVKKVIPDVRFITDTGISNNPAVNFVLKSRDFPSDSLTTESTSQILSDTQFKNLRSRSRQIVVRFESDDDLSTTDATGYKWRLGTTRVDLQPSGRR